MSKQVQKLVLLKKKYRVQSTIGVFGSARTIAHTFRTALKFLHDVEMHSLPEMGIQLKVIFVIWLFLPLSTNRVVYRDAVSERLN